MERQFRAFLWVTGVVFSLLLVRVFWLSVVSHDRLTREAVAQRVSAAELVSVRGSITDRNGTPFTDCSEGEYAVYIDGADIEAGAAEIAAQLGQSEERIITQIQNRTRLTFGPLSNLYPIERAGFMTARAPIRQDENSLARHLIGMVDAQGKGISGLEQSFETILNTGRKQSIVTLRDVRQGLLGNWGYLEANRKVDQSRHLRLTLDKEIQTKVEQIAAEDLPKGSILVSEVSTGDVVAMVSRPQFDPNDLTASLGSSDGEFLNRSLTRVNAGSVFKIVVAAAALEHGIQVSDFHCSGVYQVADRTLSCYDYTAHGSVGLDEAFSKSCNGYFVRLGEKLGMERLRDMAVRLGLSAPATNLENETAGLLPELEPYLPGRIANFSVGQGELLVTPTAMLRLVDTVANGGVLRTLNVTDGITDGQGLLVQSLRQTQKERVLSGHTAERIRQMMTQTVTGGTGKLAATEKMTAAGKTGTAETGWVENGVLQVHAWFCGFVPAEDPKYCITVFVENGQSGGEVAAPLFSRVSETLF